MRLVFFAKVTPERFALTAPELNYEAENLSTDVAYKGRLAIHYGQVVLQFSSDEQSADVDTIKNMAERDIRHYVDYCGFFHGVRFDVDVVSAVDDDGRWHVFGIQIPVLRSNLEESRDDLIRRYLMIAFANPSCAVILAQLREAMRNPPDTGLHCYRAIEAMMQSMKETLDEKDKLGWEMLRQNLRVKRSCVDGIKKHADRPRHGRINAMTDEERAYVFDKTQRIVTRFFEYLKRQEKSLPENEFPMLEA